MPLREEGIGDPEESTRPPDLREKISGRFEKHAMYAMVKVKMEEFIAQGDIKQLAVWKKEITKWANGGTILLEFDEWKLVPEKVKHIDSPERQALLNMFAESPFPSIETVRMAINAITNLQEVTEWTELPLATKENLIHDLLKSIIKSGSAEKETIIALSAGLIQEMRVKTTLVPPVNITIPA